MGTEQSKPSQSEGDGIPFVIWNNTYHFAEPSSYTFVSSKRQIFGEIVYTDPPKADTELRNAAELSGRIAIIHRGGRLHFPDIIRRMLAAGVTGCIFIEREHVLKPNSLYEGFHSSGRQKVSIPILLLSKPHADVLLQDNPKRIQINSYHGTAAIPYIIHQDIPVAITVASRNGERDVLIYLLSERQQHSPDMAIPGAQAYCEAIENGHHNCIEILHEYGISINDQKDNGTSPLMAAAASENLESLRVLVMYGAKLDLEDVHGMTAVMIATRENKPRCLQFLIQKGALTALSRNRQRGTTALHIAAQRGNLECLEILISSKVEIDVESPNSSTALMEAARSGHFSCVQVLVEAGARLDAKDREGQTAESLAAAAGHVDIEDYLRSVSENSDMKDQRRSVEYLISHGDFTLENLLSLAEDKNIDIDVLKREALRSFKVADLMRKEFVVFDVFRLMIKEPNANCPVDPVYGRYKIQHFCSEVALWYDRSIFEIPDSAVHALDLEKCYGYFNLIFNFLKQPGPLDDVILVLFCKVVSSYILQRQLGSAMLSYIGAHGTNIVPWFATHIGYDSIVDILIWLLYSELSDDGQKHIVSSGIFVCLFSRLNTWQRTLSWGVGTPYQRDSIENICTIFCNIIYPPVVSTMGDTITYVDNNGDGSLPLITDQSPPGCHNNLFHTFLLSLKSTDKYYGIFIELGLAELRRQIESNPNNIIFEGGSLSIVMMLMSTLGYHSKKRDLVKVEQLLRETRTVLIEQLCLHVENFVTLCRLIVAADTPRRLSQPEKKKKQKLQGNALLTVVTFLKRCIFMQSSVIDHALANAGCMPCLLSCYGAHPNNSLLHHELTDVIRFVLLDPAQSRLPSCPLLNSLFADGTSILDFVMDSYLPKIPPQYRGHMTTIANSVLTLTNTPTCVAAQLTVQEIVRQYAETNPKWKTFEQKLAHQNYIERQSLGQRNAPLCHGCLALKESALMYVSATLDAEIIVNGHLENIFEGTASHHLKVNVTNDFITGYVYKKDKKHDHIPIPAPTRVSSFIQYPVPMPFHALTFTITYVGLCRKCDKLWYCDTLHNPNWSTRMKWVIPTSVKKWYSFGSTEKPGGGAHGIEFSTRGYKSFLVLTDTWGRQEQWIQAIQECVFGSTHQKSQCLNWESAMAIEIDNEANDETPNQTSEKKMQRRRSSTEDATPPPKSAPNAREMNKLNLSKFQPKASLNNFSLDPIRWNSKKKAVNKDGLGIRHVVSTSDLPKLERKHLGP